MVALREEEPIAVSSHPEMDIKVEERPSQSDSKGREDGVEATFQFCENSCTT